MSGKMISEALGSLPEALVAEAMESGAKRRMPWLRIAACFAVIVGLFLGWPTTEQGIVTAPGILSVQVYAMNDAGNEAYVAVPMYDGITVNEEGYTPLVMNRWPGIPVWLSLDPNEYDTDRIYFEVSTSSGMILSNWGRELRRNKENGYYIVWDNDSSIYWTNKESPYDPIYDRIYTSIIIYEGKNIIGYSVARFDRLLGKDLAAYNDYFSDYYDDEKRTTAYFSMILDTKMFPKVEGEYQNITFAQVEQIMEAVIQSDQS